MLGLIIAIIVSAIIVNLVQSLIMRLLGANVMFFNWKSKLVIIIFLAFILKGAFGG